MTLPETDNTFLADRGIKHEMAVEGGMMCVIFRAWALPSGYDRVDSDLLVRLSPGYPDVPPDMWWFNPAIRLADGRSVRATEVHEPHLGRSWQRWSRHFVNGQWKSGVDGLESFLALIRHELERRLVDPAR